MIHINGSYVNITNEFAISENRSNVSIPYQEAVVAIHFDSSNRCRHDFVPHEKYEQFPPNDLSCNGRICQTILPVQNSTVYLGCIGGVSPVQNVQLVPIRISLEVQ